MRRSWIDRIIETGEPGRLKAVKNVTNTDDCFRDHFPLKPVLPGVAVWEAQSSLARELVRRELARRGIDGACPVLCRADKVKFRRFIEPGDQLLVEASLKSFSPGRCEVAANVTAGGKNVAASLLSFASPDRDAYLHTYVGLQAKR